MRVGAIQTHDLANKREREMSFNFLVPPSLDPLLYDPSEDFLTAWIHSLSVYLQELQGDAEREEMLGLGPEFRCMIVSLDTSSSVHKNFKIVAILVYLLCTPAACVWLKGGDALFLSHAFRERLGWALVGRNIKDGTVFTKKAQEAHVCSWADHLTCLYRFEYRGV